MVIRIDNIELSVSDIERSKDFYGTLFGWTFTDFGPTYCEFNDGWLTGGFSRSEQVSTGGPLLILYHHELDDIQNRIVAAGGIISQPVFSFPGGQRFHFLDPDGNELAVWSAVAEEQSELPPADFAHLQRCVELAREAVEAGDSPFGSLLVHADGRVLFEDRNRTSAGDATRHPEFAIARWAAEFLTPAERAEATVYTSGEHCPMCAAAHGMVGLGRIVYASSSEQLRAWQAQLGVSPGRVRSLPINSLVPDVQVAGPEPRLADEIFELHRQHRMPQR